VCLERSLAGCAHPQRQLLLFFAECYFFALGREWQKSFYLRQPVLDVSHLELRQRVVDRPLRVDSERKRVLGE